jgi:hypothetical protein
MTTSSLTRLAVLAWLVVSIRAQVLMLDWRRRGT